MIRPPHQRDYVAWVRLRRASSPMLRPWEPSWSHDHLSQVGFRRRVRWSEREIQAGRAYPLLIFERDARAGLRLAGGVTLEHVRLGAAMSASLGYWLGVDATGRGLMSEALEAVVAFAFDELDLSRLEAACLPENARSRRLLERAGFVEEGRANAYLKIDGRWRDHVLYERRRSDRVDETAAKGETR
ncbi:MAG: GNAT family protein [Pseudomonadota bacterium]